MTRPYPLGLKAASAMSVGVLRLFHLDDDRFDKSTYAFRAGHFPRWFVSVFIRLQLKGTNKNSLTSNKLNAVPRKFTTSTCIAVSNSATQSSRWWLMAVIPVGSGGRRRRRRRQQQQQLKIKRTRQAYPVLVKAVHCLTRLRCPRFLLTCTPQLTTVHALT